MTPLASTSVPFAPDLERIDATFITKHWDFRHSCEMSTNEQITPPTATRLITALTLHLPHIPPDSWPERLSKSGAFINGVQSRSDHDLPSVARIEYYEPRYDYKNPELFFPSFDASRICYEDEFLLVYVKPSKLPCVPGREQQYFNLRYYLEQYVGKPIHMPSRLDMSTCGLVPVSKHPIMHDPLQQIFQKRRITKVYRLNTDQTPAWRENEVISYIAKHPLHPVLRWSNPDEGKEAKTQFTVLKRRATAGALLEARPITGRTHQIRVHAHSLGLPIIGDNFYMGTKAETLHLACFQLKFNHPLSHEELTIQIPEELQPDWLVE
jgi:23S rRNA-/tRNA-specific pseudouridylate synthase